MAQVEGEWQAPAHQDGDATSAAPAAVAPCFGSVEDFVEGFLSVATELRTGGPVTWCPKWWAHPEAVLRITALWHAWETLRLEPGTGTSTWWTLHYDPHMRLLVDAERGPFAYCGREHAQGKPGPLALEKPANDWQTRSLR
jgi:hypothetical protein